MFISGFVFNDFYPGPNLLSTLIGSFQFLHQSEGLKHKCGVHLLCNYYIILNQCSPTTSNCIVILIAKFVSESVKHLQQVQALFLSSKASCNKSIISFSDKKLTIFSCLYKCSFSFLPTDGAIKVGHKSLVTSPHAVPYKQLDEKASSATFKPEINDTAKRQKRVFR